MANVTSPDLLPVKEDSWKPGKGISDKFDYQLLGKLTRCELEDKFLRLLDEQTQIKKLANTQEEKIKRLGTKLLRLLNEKKLGRNPTNQTRSLEDLELRVIELEHENYALKDKNVVLKQQLSSHSRRPPNHRSPHRSSYTSPLMTTRPPPLPPQRENTREPNEMQIQEAESHINELNDEIKCLHNKIDFLQRNLEKSCLDNRKIKVTENIELIRLQRSLKQQAIQIAALQAQIRSSENSQRGLKEELIKAHKENDEALHLIALKQNEILNLCNKLGEKNLNKLEEEELKGRIEDLLRERDCLKERSEYLMKKIGSKNAEAHKKHEIQKICAEEKRKKDKLDDNLETRNKHNAKNADLIKQRQYDDIESVDTAKTFFDNKKECSPESSEDSECLCNRCNFYVTICKCSQETIKTHEVETESELTESVSDKDTPCFPANGQCEAEKIKMKRELQCLREMLRNQTMRCEAQQAEIARLMCELKLNEEKCNETLKRLEFHLKIFQCLELQERQKGRNFADEQLQTSDFASGRESVFLPPAYKEEEPRHQPMPVQKLAQKDAKTQTSVASSPEKREVHTQCEKLLGIDVGVCAKMESLSGSLDCRDFEFRQASKELPPAASTSTPKRKSSFSEECLLPKPAQTKKAVTVDKERTFRPETEKKRFVEQKFLDSSDDDLKGDETFKRDSFLSKVKKMEDDNQSRIRDSRRDDESEESDAQLRSISPKKSKMTKYNYAASTTVLRQEHKKDDYDQILVSILWLRVQEESTLWKNNDIEMLFVDFTFLDLRGAETETPQSLSKPVNCDDACQFNFVKRVDITGPRKKLLNNLLKNPDDECISFKVVSDSEKFDETNAECEDIGVASLTVKEFLHYCNNGPFYLRVKNIKDPSEIIGTLGLNFEAPPSLLNSRK